jgi:hypothetical protein
MAKGSAVRWRNILVHGVVLAGSNLAAIGAGFVVWWVIDHGGRLQVPIQTTVAAVLNLAGFALWFRLTHDGGRGRLALAGAGDLAPVWLLALPAGWCLFVPLHLVSEGYLTSVGNLVAASLYAAPANALILGICRRLGPWREREALPT